MRARVRCNLLAGVVASAIAAGLASTPLPAYAEDPPAHNPFGTPDAEAPTDREGQTPGYVELSDGSIHAGMLFLTRDKRLQIVDDKVKRQREIPLTVVKTIECKVKREWLEKEWKFKELTNDEKMFTGRSYPAREYIHVITLHDGRTIEGGLSGIVFVQPQTYDPQKPGAYRPAAEPERFVLHKRDKGEMGSDLKSLVYVKLVKVGDEAYREGKDKAARQNNAPAKSDKNKTGDPPSKPS